MDIILILLVALAVEFTVGDPPNAIHPVAWLGKVISFFERFGFIAGKTYQFLYGALITVILTLAVFTAAWFLVDWLKDINYWLLYRRHRHSVEDQLQLRLSPQDRSAHQALIEKDDTIDQARFELRALVSRNTSKLSRPYLVSATVESVSESLCDSLVSPLFFFVTASCSAVRLAGCLRFPCGQYLRQHDRLPRQIRIPRQVSGPT